MSEPDDVHGTLVRLVRDEGRRVLATLIRQLGDLALAEDAVQEATLRALQVWPEVGLPEQPRAWLILTARRYAVDVLRREATRDSRQRQAELTQLVDSSPEDEVLNDSVLRDDQLRLIFICCHPALSPEAQVALSLRTVCGFTVAEVARALLVSEATMQRRLTRVRQKIKVAHIPYAVPEDHELPTRLAGVAATTYLIFNEGYTASSGDELIRISLLDEAIRLGRLLVELLPDEASLQGLLALMLLQHARTPARINADGEPVLLADQDRSRWRKELTREAVKMVGWALPRCSMPDRYVVQAAIAACHNLAPDFAHTDWDAVISWYHVLMTVDESPVVRLNRAVAVAERDGPAVGLAEVEAIDDLASYGWWHATRAELLLRLGRRREAVEAYDAALALDLSEPVAGRLAARRQSAVGHSGVSGCGA